MAAWYYVDEQRQTVGPLSQDRLLSLLSGMAKPGELFVWSAGFDAYVGIRRVLYRYAKRTPGVEWCWHNAGIAGLIGWRKLGELRAVDLLVGADLPVCSLN